VVNEPEPYGCGRTWCDCSAREPGDFCKHLLVIVEPGMHGMDHLDASMRRPELPRSRVVRRLFGEPT
jgi:hypothetical protein